MAKAKKETQTDMRQRNGPFYAKHPKDSSSHSDPDEAAKRVCLQLNPAG